MYQWHYPGLERVRIEEWTIRFLKGREWGGLFSWSRTGFQLQACGLFSLLFFFRGLFYMFFFCVFAVHDVFGNCSPPSKTSWSFLSLPSQSVETADYPLFLSAVLPTRHGILRSHCSDMMSVCFRSSWLGKLVLWNAVKTPVWADHQTRHHCRQRRHAACGSSEIRSLGKKSTNAHVGIFARLCCWRGEEKKGRAFKQERSEKITLWV